MSLTLAARQLARVREAFLTTGDLRDNALRRLVHDSWLRCRLLRVDVSRRNAVLGLSTDSALDHLRAANAALIAAAQPVLTRLNDALAASGYVVALGDEHARLLEVTGNPTLLRRLECVDFLPGSDWSEATAGTNAIGIALQTGHTVQLTAAEHYCEGWQDVTCTAAPIRNPRTGQLLGALDITGDYRLARPFLTTYLATAARSVEESLRVPPTRRAPRLWSGVGSAGLAEGELSSARRRTRLAERLTVAAGTISASLHPGTTAERVAAQAAYTLEAPAVAVGRFDAEGTLRVTAHTAEWPADPRAVFGLLAHEITVLRDWNEPALIARIPGDQSISALLLPLAAADDTFGALVLLRAASKPWHTDDLRMGLILAAQAATALENAELFARLQQQHRHMAILNDLGHLLRTLIEPLASLEHVLDAVVELTGFDDGIAIFLDDASGSTLHTVYSTGLRAAGSHADGRGTSLRGLVEQASTGDAGVAWCAHEVLAVVQHEVLAAHSACDLLATPLAVSGGMPGVLVLISREHRPTLEADRQLLAMIGQQLALTLRNSRLVRAAGEQAALNTADQLKSMFLTSVSHELRSPLTALRTTVESLLDRRELLDADEGANMLHHVGRQVGRLSRLVDQLLDASQIEAGAFRIDRDWVDLGVLIADTLDAFARLGATPLVEQDIAPDLPPQYIDPDSIAQVLWNLLENAVKYSPPGAPLLITACQTSTGVLLEVADRGPGVPPEQRKQIFEHFYRLPHTRKARVPGCGLGLAICCGIVQAHGGEIWVEQRAGGGSVFRVQLPPPPAEPLELEGDLCR